jgi:hypothetical protein
MIARLTCSLLATVIALLLGSTSSHAASPSTVGPLPLRGQFAGLHVSRTPVAPPVVFDRFETEGTTTLLGRFTLVIEATVDFGARPVTATGTYTFTAANGDQLVADHTGSSALVRPGTVLITEHATIDPDRSTGRFAGAQGSFTVERLADAATGVGGVTTGSVNGAVFLVPAG